MPGSQQPNPNLPVAEIALGPLPAGGAVLDVCCGGEGVIARAYPGRVLGVDRQLSEIKECRVKCPPETVFLVADATRTQFVDNTFAYVTCFFGLMYVRGPEHKRALLAEAARVLRPGGAFLIWGANIPAGTGPFGLEVRATLPNGETIRTAYGAGGRGKEQDLALVKALAAEAGLRAEVAEDHGPWFRGEFVKVRE